MAETAGPGDELQPVRRPSHDGAVRGARSQVVHDGQLVGPERVEHGQGAVTADHDEGVVPASVQLVGDPAPVRAARSPATPPAPVPTAEPAPAVGGIALFGPGFGRPIAR